jgi:hypothetical protein
MLERSIIFGKWRLRMSVEYEVKAVEAVVAEVVAEAKTVETKVETVAEAVVADAKTDAKEVKAAIVNINSDEKLFLREAELEFLKAQMEIQRLSKIAEEKSKGYQAYIEALFKKYLITMAEYVFDGSVNAFKLLDKKL